MLLRYGATVEAFSSIKSKAVLIRGNLTPGFTIPFGDERITTTSKAKYLGIWIDQGLTFKPHIRSLKENNLQLFSRLRSTLGHNWGMSRENASLLYQTVFLPKILYGAEFWYEAASGSEGRRVLQILQRKALLAITSAYKTASTEALQVISGTLPLDLEASLQGTRSSNRGNHNLDQIFNIKRIGLIEVWQRRWSESTKSAWTHKLFPDVKVRLSVPLWTNHHLSQFLTGHGKFRGKLFSLGPTDSPLCDCGEAEETPKHILFSCPRSLDLRNDLKEVVISNGYP